MQKIILASESPRRKELLMQLGLTFEVISGDVDESETDGSALPPDELVKKLSDAKATAVIAKTDGGAVIIAADTIVCLNGEIMGKPRDEQEAFDMLKKLQGKAHYVYTGVTIIKKSGADTVKKQFAERTLVNMGQITDTEIKSYVDTKEPLDKAGSYAIQSMGACFVKSVEGDYNTVVGLPLFKLYNALKELEINLMQ